MRNSILIEIRQSVLYKQFHSIRGKLVACNTLLLAAIALFINFYFPSQIEKYSLNSMVNKTESIAKMTAYSVGAAVRFEDKDAVNEVIGGASQDKDLHYLVICDSWGHEIRAYNKQAAIEYNYREGFDNSGFTDDGLIYRYQTSINFENKKIGTLYLGLSLSDVRHEIFIANILIAAFSLLVFILGTIGIIWISTVVTKPLSEISKTANEIAEGNLTRRVDNTPNDEIGMLGAAFNLMVDSLAKAQADLGEINRNLEYRVSERTSQLQDEIQVRKNTESELERSLALVRATLESTADGILVIDSSGKVAGYNLKFVKMWRIGDDVIATGDDSQLLKEVLDQLKSPDDFLQKVQLLYSQPEAESFDQLEFKDGRAFERYSLPQKSGDKIVGRVWSFRDVSERRNLEEHLRQMQKMEAIGKLAGGVAHDFNNILTIITGYCELMLIKMPEDNPMRRHVTEIKTAGERAAGLTGQLLAFSRKQVLAPKILELNSVINNMDKMLHRLIGEDIELVFRQNLELEHIKADPGQIEQVILNLAVNARDAMPDGGTLILESANVELDESYSLKHISVVPGKYVMLAVSDTGMGMSPDVQARIFEPFFTTKEVGKGTGLGLSTVYGIVKQSGGNIWVYSEEGHGTTFKVYFPIVQVQETDTVMKSSNNMNLMGSETILLVEDEDGVRELAFSVLKGYGYKVFKASSGEEAISICNALPDKIDLMLSDVVMPKMNGQQLSEYLKPRRPDMKVLFMSGYTDETILRYGVMQLTTAYLQKPFTPDSLGRKIREVLENKDPVAIA
jgi:two-component system, cell cycle sensor histidine kinase and response regulator CckA